MILSDFNFSFTESGFSTTLTGSAGLNTSTGFWGSASFCLYSFGMKGAKTLSPTLNGGGTVKGTYVAAFGITTFSGRTSFFNLFFCMSLYSILSLDSNPSKPVD